jgi:positive regulator of sigma E activity
VTETGRVTKIEGDIITLRRGPGPACGGCRAHCGGGGEITARNPRRIALKPGDEAEIFLSAGTGLFSVVKVFGIPALAFTVFFIAAGMLSGWKESLCVLAGFAGLILAAFVLFFAGRRNQVFPEILRAAETEPDSNSDSYPV